MRSDFSDERIAEFLAEVKRKVESGEGNIDQGKDFLTEELFAAEVRIALDELFCGTFVQNGSTRILCTVGGREFEVSVVSRFIDND